MTPRPAGGGCASSISHMLWPVLTVLCCWPITGLAFIGSRRLVAAIWAVGGDLLSSMVRPGILSRPESGKQGISIDLKKLEGIELCLRLIEKMDVLIENFLPLAGLWTGSGLGYRAAKARNPRLVYCSISGYGQDGPSRDEAAMDLIVQSSSGLVSITGTESGDQVRCGYSVADVTAGMFAVMGILMALQGTRALRGRSVHRRRYAGLPDLDDVLELHDVPRFGRAAGPAGNKFRDSRTIPRLSRKRSQGIRGCGRQR